MIGFRVLDDNDRDNFDEHGKLRDWVADEQKKLTSQVQKQLRARSREISKSVPHVVPRSTLGKGLEKYALGRRFYIRKSGFFGVGSRESTAGDRVAVLFGVAVAVVL